MMCSDSANGVVGRDKCTGVFNCWYFCDGDLCNLAPGLVAKAGIHSANLKDWSEMNVTLEPLLIIV